ncbi:MAG: hypothetical protein GKR89_36575 [Candidatus Latescibacteria bacterium]|nr:hypothetical protein [Candidatus Latescibacterota bacterium]
MDYFIKHGTALSVAVGTEAKPEISRWASWGHGDLQQSFILHTADGPLITDPVIPAHSPALQAIKARAGKVAGIVSLSSLHERDLAAAGKRYRAPIYGPDTVSKTTRYGRQIENFYQDGETLPGGVQALYSGDENGEMWLYWKTPSGIGVLINADTIYGQTRQGDMGGKPVSYWMQEGGIRLRATGKVDKRALRKRYEKLDGLDIDLVLNGHNSLPLEGDPKETIETVLAKGTYEVHESGRSTFVYMDLR